MSDEGTIQDELDDFFGSWIDDEAVDAALDEQRELDLRDWD